MNEIIAIHPFELNANGARISQAIFEETLRQAGNLHEWKNLDIFVAPDVWSDLVTIYGDPYHADRIHKVPDMHYGEIHIARRGASPDDALLARIFSISSSPAAGKPAAGKPVTKHVTLKQERKKPKTIDELENTMMIAAGKMAKTASKLAAQSKVIANEPPNPAYLREWRFGIQEAQSALDAYTSAASVLSSAKSPVS